MGRTQVGHSGVVDRTLVGYSGLNTGGALWIKHNGA